MVLMNGSRRGGSRLPVVLLVTLTGLALVLAATGWVRVWRRGAEGEALRMATNEVGRLRAEVQSLRDQREILDEELDRVREQTQEIHRLRAQYQELLRLREDHAKADQQLAQLKAQNQTLQAQLRSRGGGTRTPNRGAMPAAGAPWLGVSIQAVTTAEKAEGVPGGVVVQTLVPGGPAVTSGLQVGDIITSVDSQSVTTVAQLQALVQRKRVGQRVSLDVLRDGEQLRLAVTTTATPGFR